MTRSATHGRRSRHRTCYGYALAPLPDGAPATRRSRRRPVRRRRPPIASSRFDPGSGRWAPVTAAIDPSDRTHRSPSSSDGRVLVAGGAITMTTRFAVKPCGPPRSSIQYAGSWSTTSDLLEPRDGRLAVVLEDGSVLVLGGSADFNTQGEVPWCPTPRRQSTDASRPGRLSVHASGCILPVQLNGRSVTWVTPTFCFERRFA